MERPCFCFCFCFHFHFITPTARQLPLHPRRQSLPLGFIIPPSSRRRLTFAYIITFPLFQHNTTLLLCCLLTQTTTATTSTTTTNNKHGPTSPSPSSSLQSLLSLLATPFEIELHAPSAIMTEMYTQPSASSVAASPQGHCVSVNIPPSSIPMPPPSTAARLRSNLAAAETYSPVNQNGSFEFDRVIKSGYVQKRTSKTKVRHWPVMRVIWCWAVSHRCGTGLEDYLSCLASQHSVHLQIR